MDGHPRVADESGLCVGVLEAGADGTDGAADQLGVYCCGDRGTVGRVRVGGEVVSIIVPPRPEGALALPPVAAERLGTFLVVLVERLLHRVHGEDIRHMRPVS